MYQLISPTTVTLAHINLRDEKHGKEDVKMVDLDFSLDGENIMLDALDPALRERLCYDPDATSGQQTMPGVPKTMPKRYLPRLGTSFKWEQEQTGMDLVFIYGVGDERSNIELTDGRLKIKGLEIKDNGGATIRFQYSTASIPDGAVDKLRMLTGRLVTITLVQPEKLRQDAAPGGDDKSGELFEKRPKSKKGASTAPKDGEASKVALDASGKSPFPHGTPEAALAGTQH